MYRPVLLYKDWMLFRISVLEKTYISEKFVGKSEDLLCTL
jgi:hypothetical protein